MRGKWRERWRENSLVAGEELLQLSAATRLELQKYRIPKHTESLNSRIKIFWCF
jgi:hypothetical protein